MNFDDVMRSAAQLQDLVPDAVLVGGSAAVLYAGHRTSQDHDHVVADLVNRFDAILEALESDPDWVLNRAVPGKIILGSLGDIEAGIRQLIRRRPLETQIITIPGESSVNVPTAEETLRIKGYLIVKRNQVRDYIDVAALSHCFGIPWAAATFAAIDDFYGAENNNATAVAAQLVRQLGEPRPRDSRTTQQLSQYKNLAPQWQTWIAVVEQCQAIADAMMA